MLRRSRFGVRRRPTGRVRVARRRPGSRASGRIHSRRAARRSWRWFAAAIVLRHFATDVNALSNERALQDISHMKRWKLHLYSSDDSVLLYFFSRIDYIDQRLLDFFCVLRRKVNRAHFWIRWIPPVYKRPIKYCGDETRSNQIHGFGWLRIQIESRRYNNKVSFYELEFSSIKIL